MDTILHKLIKAVVNELSEALPISGESGSEVSYFITEPRNFSEVTRLSEYIRKPWIKETMKEVKNLINNKIFKVDGNTWRYRITLCMYVYKATIQYDGSLDKLKLRIVVRGDLQYKDSIGDAWSPTASMRALKYSLVDSVKYKKIVHQLDFIG